MKHTFEFSKLDFADIEAFKKALPLSKLGKVDYLIKETPEHFTLTLVYSSLKLLAMMSFMLLDDKSFWALRDVKETESPDLL